MDAPVVPTGLVVRRVLLEAWGREEQQPQRIHHGRLPEVPKYREDDDAKDITVDTFTYLTYDPSVRGVVSTTPTTSLADYTSVQREKEARIFRE